jgi:hypothetical protein
MMQPATGRITATKSNGSSELLGLKGVSPPPWKGPMTVPADPPLTPEQLVNLIRCAFRVNHPQHVEQALQANDALGKLQAIARRAALEEAIRVVRAQRRADVDLPRHASFNLGVEVAADALDALRDAAPPAPLVEPEIARGIDGTYLPEPPAPSSPKEGER